MRNWRPSDRDSLQAPAARAAMAEPVALTAAELRLLARLEGRSLPRGQALSSLLGVSERAAWALIRRLRRQGALGFVSAVRLDPATCQCVTDLKVDWARLGDAEVLEAELRADPAITTADRVAGACDYRLFSRHGDFRRAAAWDRRLATLPGVAGVRTRFCAAVREAPRFAAIRLGLEDRSAP